MDSGIPGILTLLLLLRIVISKMSGLVAYLESVGEHKVLPKLVLKI